VETAPAELMLSLARAGFILGSGVLVALMVRMLAPRLAAAFYGAAGVQKWDDRLVSAFSLLAVVGILITAGYAAINELALTDQQRVLVARLSLALVTAIATLVALRLLTLGVEAYVARAALDRTAVAYLYLLRKIGQVALLVVGVLLVLDQLGYKATALLAGVGLVSLGVGLALQDTLANFFAGIWMALDRPVSRGDFIELDGGQAGWVIEIGWRHCRLRTLDDTVVVVPNSRLASSVLINRSLPKPEMSVYVPCGVSYESDLEHVEAVCLEVARAVQQTAPGALPDWEPFVLFDEFAAENITFTVALRIGDPSARRQVRHEFIKALKARLDAEGIEINYPVRTVYLRGEQKGARPRPPADPPPGREEG